MKVLMISTDRNIFSEGSAVRQRMLEYGTLFEELHIVVFTLKASDFPTSIQLSRNTFVYGTASRGKLLYVFDALGLAKKIMRRHAFSRQTAVITAQDPFETGLVAFFAARSADLAYQLQVHTDLMSPQFKRYSFLNRIRIPLAKFLLRRASGIRVVSEKIGTSLKTLVLTCEPVVMPIYVSHKVRADRHDLRSIYPQFEIIIIMATRFAPEKNTIFAIDVYASIHDQFPKTGLLIYGAGPLEKKIHDLVSLSRVSSSVIVHPWQENLSSCFESADIFLSTSLYEGYGMALVEATSAGMFVVTSDVGVARELEKKTDRVRVVPDFSLEHFSLILKKAIEDAKSNREKKPLHLEPPLVYGSKEEHLAAQKESLEAILRHSMNRL